MFCKRLEHIKFIYIKNHKINETMAITIIKMRTPNKYLEISGILLDFPLKFAPNEITK